MTSLDYKVIELTRDRSQRGCDTCKHSGGAQPCAVVGDRDQCIYQDMLYWQPNKKVFVEKAKAILGEEN